MIIIVTNLGSDLEKINYVFSTADAKDRDRCAIPKVIAGNRELLQLVVAASPFTHKYINIIFSWGEPLDSVGEPKIKNVVEDFLCVLTAGLAMDDFSRLAVLHQPISTWQASRNF